MLSLYWNYLWANIHFSTLQLFLFVWFQTYSVELSSFKTLICQLSVIVYKYLQMGNTYTWLVSIVILLSFCTCNPDYQIKLFIPNLSQKVVSVWYKYRVRPLEDLPCLVLFVVLFLYFDIEIPETLSELLQLLVIMPNPDSEQMSQVLVHHGCISILFIITISHNISYLILKTNVF
jgi:hypothetical protein